MRSLIPWPIFPANLDPPVARSLSILFILQSLIEGFKLLNHLQIVTPEQLQGVDCKQEIASISQQLEKFLIFSLENPLAQKGSILGKLCFYSEILLQASRIGDNEIPMILENMRDLVLKIKTKITPLKHAVLIPLLSPLLALYSDLLEKLNHFFKLLIPYLKQARSDENVLVFLIENKDSLNASLGPRCIEDLLQSFFPAGHDQLRAAIIEGYTRRGFSVFLSKIEPLIDAIEWETPCYLTNC